MPVVDLLDLPARLCTGERVFGLDLGRRVIGVAVSDPQLTVASPLDALVRRKFTADADRLLAAMAARHAAGLVLGLPLNMDGSEGPRAQAARAFAWNLLRLADRPIAFWDERLSTVAVTRAMLEADLTRRHRREKVDSAAAAYILQGALDRLAVAGGVPTGSRTAG